jgi:hypothetical protein
MLRRPWPEHAAHRVSITPSSSHVHAPCASLLARGANACSLRKVPEPHPAILHPKLRQSNNSASTPKSRPLHAWSHAPPNAPCYADVGSTPYPSAPEAILALNHSPCFQHEDDSLVRAPAMRSTVRDHSTVLASDRCTHPSAGNVACPLACLFLSLRFLA